MQLSIDSSATAFLKQTDHKGQPLLVSELMAAVLGARDARELSARVPDQQGARKLKQVLKGYKVGGGGGGSGWVRVGVGGWGWGGGAAARWEGAAAACDSSQVLPA